MTPPVSVRDIRAAVAARDWSAEAVCRAALDRIARLDPALHAFLTVDAERAVEDARAFDRGHDGVTPRPLAGVPVAVKDNICTRGLRTTAGSRMLEHFVPPYDATVVERLRAAGAIIVGKTNCDEFAMGSSNENSAFGATRNPWRLAHAPGGSSGGSAAAVAAGLVPVALGSDTGGSIRQPAAFCGVVGLKPTYGRVSRFGLIAFGSSLDQIGPMAASVEDVALTFAALAGPDARDATSSPEAFDGWQPTDAGCGGLRVGVPRAWLSSGLAPSVADAFERALDVLRAAGATVSTVDLPHAHHAIPVYYLVATAEASSNLARYDGVRYGFRASAATDLDAMYRRTRSEGFGREVKRRIMLGTYVLSQGYYDAYYLKAQQVRTLIRRDYERAFEDVDVIATPTTPTPAFPLGSRLDDPLQMYLADVFTVSANLTGHPALSLPCGQSPDGLPIGLQVTGRPFDERRLFDTGHAFEARTPWHTRRPDVSAGD
ncbi:MAG: Asp-tRNA(Asn)/Glu-tRNA(Gln) amidotransferase subunit GatA [Vicinamibacterales bacterium]